MQQCLHCYRTYEDGVEICDCGRPLVQQTGSWLQRKVRCYLSPPCPQCGQPRLEELTAENNGYGRVTATMRCANCQQWHVVQRVGLPYHLLLLIGVILVFFLLQASESTLLVKFILGVANLILALQRWLWPSASQVAPSKMATDAVPERKAVKNFTAWLDDVAWRQGNQSARPDDERR